MSTRKAHWEDIYHNRDHQQVGWYQETPQISLTLLEQIGAKPSDALIDVGCGASLLVDHLIQQGYRNISLLDLSQKALDSVKTRLGEQGNIPHYFHSDITQIELGQSYDIWHDRAVFHFLTQPDDRQQYMRKLDQYLAPSGRVIIGTFSLAGPTHCSGLKIVRYDLKKMQAELPEGLQIFATEENTHIKPDGDQQAYQYFMIRREN